MPVTAPILLLKLAALSTLFIAVALNCFIVLAWFALGVLDGDWSFVPLWLILLSLILGFVQFLLSAFIFGVARQVLTKSGAEMKDLPLSDRLSETLDQGWSSSTKTARWSVVVTLTLFLLSGAIFYKDVVFLVSLHRGMQMSQESKCKGAQVWFAKSVWAAGPDREPVARFLLAGSLIQDKQYAQAESELLKALAQPAAKDDQTLLVFLYTGLCSCDVLQNKLSDAEVAAKKAVEIVEKNANLPVIELRLIATYKQSMIAAPSLTTTLRVLEQVYVKQQNCELAVATYKRIFKGEQADASLTWQDYAVQLTHLNDLQDSGLAKDCAEERQRVMQETKDYCLKKFAVKESDFKAMQNSK